MSAVLQAAPALATDVNVRLTFSKNLQVVTNKIDQTAAMTSTSATPTLDLNTYKDFELTANANITAMTISGGAGSVKFGVYIKQDATGSRSCVWFAGITWVGGATPDTVTDSANKKSAFGFRRTGANTYEGYIMGRNF